MSMVRPSFQTIPKNKQIQASFEANVAISLLEKPEDVKTTFHYGITKPCNIDGGIHDHKRFYYNRICFEAAFLCS